MASPVLFEDIFEVQALNPGDSGKRFARVTRAQCQGSTYNVAVLMDVNSELFPVKEGDRVTVALASTLRDDGEPDDGTYQHDQDSALMNAYQYVMHGRVFKYERSATQQQEAQVSIFISYGGLLMRIRGDQEALSAISMDQTLYCLMRRGGVDAGLDR